MSRIENAFKNGKAFIPFVTAGDPNLETTERLVLAIAEAGADIIELGIPFSDPVAEGVVIQQADERALASGTDYRQNIRYRPAYPPENRCAVGFYDVLKSHFRLWRG